MKRLLLAYVALVSFVGVIACTKPDLPTLLTWVDFGIQADCQFGVGALAADLCTFGHDAVSAASAAYAHDPVTGRIAVKKILVDAEARQPKITPYTHWLTSQL